MMSLEDQAKQWIEMGFELNNVVILNNMSDHIAGEQTIDLQVVLTRRRKTHEVE